MRQGRPVQHLEHGPSMKVVAGLGAVAVGALTAALPLLILSPRGAGR